MSHKITRPDGVDVIVPTWNRKWLMAQALDELLMKFNDPRAHVIIWDNHSTDGTTEYIVEVLKDATFKGDITHHVAKKNCYSNSWYEAYALGTGGRFVIPTGDDVIWYPDNVIDKTLRAFGRFPDFGFIGYLSWKDDKSVGGYFSSQAKEGHRFKYRRVQRGQSILLVNGPVGTPGITTREFVKKSGGFLSLQRPKWGGFDARLTQGMVKVGLNIGLFLGLRVYHANSVWWNRFNPETYAHKHRSKGNKINRAEFERWMKLEPTLKLFDPPNPREPFGEIYARAEAFRKAFGLKEPF